MKNIFVVWISVILVVVFVSAGLTYAAVSTNLQINGILEDTSAAWDVRFENLVTRTSGDVEVATEPTITATAIETYNVILKKPGDKVYFMFDVTNGGKLDAVISIFTMPTPRFIGTGTTASADEKLIENNLIYTLKYADDSNISEGDILAAGDSISVNLAIEYDSRAQLPQNAVTIEFPTVTILYGQV